MPGGTGGASIGGGRPLRGRHLPGTGADLHFGPNMAPMVDVVLVILIFFMGAAVFVGPEWFLGSMLTQPIFPSHAAGPADTPDDDPQPRDPMLDFNLPGVRLRIELEVSADGGVLATGMGVQRQPVSVIVARLRALAEGAAADEITVLVAPRPDVPYEAVVQVQESAYALGIRALAVEMLADRREAPPGVDLPGE